MARPRVFVSSTYYDLKHIRSSRENFIESLGFKAILSEKGDIAYTPDIPLDESCYSEVENSDIFVIIIGGRYGSEKSGSKKKMPSNSSIDMKVSPKRSTLMQSGEMFRYTFWLKNWSMLNLKLF